MINLDKSHIKIYSEKDFINIDIRSILKVGSREIYLLKECRAEVNTRKPFSEVNNRYEWLPIIDDNEIYSYSEGVLNKDNSNHEKHLIDSEIQFLTFEETLEHLSSNNHSKIFCQIEYEYQNDKFELISKCELINYKIKDNYEFIQPLMGYVPFIDNNKINYGYAVIHNNKKNDGYLEYLLNENNPIFETKPLKKFININNNELKLVKIKSQNFIILLIKNAINKLFFFKKRNNFTNLISIKDYKIKYFQYIN